MVAATESDPRLVPEAATPSHSASLPVDVVSASAQRLMQFMYVVAAADALYTVLYLTVWREYGIVLGRVVAVIQILGSLALARYLRRCARAETMVTRIGVAYELAICFSLALVEFVGGPPIVAPEERVSWICVIIVLFPVLLPTRPRMMAAVSFAAATMMPLAYAVSPLFTHRAAGPASALASHFVPAYVCAAISVFLSVVIHRLGTEVGRARRLGSYELVDQLGVGGMGEVWRARHQLLVRPAAIKLIRPNALGDDEDPSAGRELRERFEREAQATSLLTSPHTVELYDFGVSNDGVFYYVMELLDGIDLDTLVREYGPLSPERVVWMLRQACDSLDDAHRSGLVHRDVKPANIVATRRGRHHDYVKVLDFGLVKGSPPGARDVQLTNDTRIKGTPAFMAPEAATGGSGVDARSDIYALGCVAYWLLTGAYVFDASTAVSMAIAQVTQTPAPASERSQLPIPAELDRVILQCLEKNPTARPPSALALQKLLEAVPFANPWNEERAAAWWREHRPAPSIPPSERAPAVARVPTVVLPVER
jgi:serine/threonine-protein kinase